MSLIPHVNEGKRCFTYCGDGVCTCSASMDPRRYVKWRYRYNYRLKMWLLNERSFNMFGLPSVHQPSGTLR